MLRIIDLRNKETIRTIAYSLLTHKAVALRAVAGSGWLVDAESMKGIKFTKGRRATILVRKMLHSSLSRKANLQCAHIAKGADWRYTRQEICYIFSARGNERCRRRNTTNVKNRTWKRKACRCTEAQMEPSNIKTGPVRVAPSALALRLKSACNVTAAVNLQGSLSIRLLSLGKRKAPSAGCCSPNAAFFFFFLYMSNEPCFDRCADVMQKCNAFWCNID